MSFHDDTCDFCGGYVDGIGCDTKTFITVPGDPVRKYWDGQCLEGMEARWSHLTIEELIELAAAAQASYDADPIDWDWTRPENAHLTQGERLRKRLSQTQVEDLAWQARKYATIRRQRI